MLREIPADYDSRLSDKVMLPSGRVHWPELLYARPVGCRALTLDLFAPGAAGPYPTIIWIQSFGVRSQIALVRPHGPDQVADLVAQPSA